MGFFRIFKLLRCLLGGSACCQQSAEVRGSRRLLSLPSTLALLLGDASTLLQRHQLLHWRDGGPHRLHRPAQEGLFFFVLRFALFYFLCSYFTSTETQEEWHYYNRFCLLVHRVNSSYHFIWKLIFYCCLSGRRPVHAHPPAGDPDNGGDP